MTAIREWILTWAHHCVVIDSVGWVLMSRRVTNDEAP